MRLLVLLPRLGVGGMEKMRLNLLEELRGRDLDILLAVARQSGELVDSLPADLKVVQVSRAGRVGFVFGLWRLLADYRPTHVLAAADDVNCIAIRLSRLVQLKPRVVVSIHSTLSQQVARSRGLLRVKLLLIRRMMRHEYPRAHAVVSVSSGVADDLVRQIGLGRNRITVIHNPILTRRTDALMAEELPSNWPKDNTPVVLYVGRLSKEKRPDLLLEAFEMVVSRRPAKLLFVGTGPMLGWLDREIDRRGLRQVVHLYGFQVNVFPLMKAAALLVLPSDYEGLPNVLVEAMACGTQVVATDCLSGPAEILGGGQYGQLVPVGNAEILAAAISDVLDGKFHVSPDTLRARAAKFSAVHCAAAYLRVLQGHHESVETSRG